MADELSKAAGVINRPRMPEHTEVEVMADHISIAGFYGVGELSGAVATERAQLYKMTPDENPDLGRMTGQKIR